MGGLGTTRRILVVEDVADIATVILHLCALEGYDAVGLTDGAEALAAATCPPDLVLLDLRMPPPDGFDVARALRAAHPDLPILAVTALTLPDEHARAYDCGVDEVIVKPFDPDALAARLAAWLAPDRPATRRSAGLLDTGAAPA